MMSGMISKSNPFFYGNPVSPDQFIGRRQELRRITNRIVNQGQSTAVVGEPRIGKTSLLLYLAAPETRGDLYESGGERLLFSFIDNQALGGRCNQAQFWELALRPLHEGVIVPASSLRLVQAYRTCQKNAFGTFTLERLLAQMNTEGWRLVLLLDEFDVLLHHQVLSCAEFFGGLRTLASRSRALALVIASRHPLTSLNKDTQQFSRTGSPYFNFLDEITLGPLPKKAITQLLDRAGDRFTTEDRRFIAEVAGGHPYLLQVAAYELWETYEDGEENPYLRRRQAWESLYDKAALILGDTWRLWSPATRRAFTAVALAHIPRLLKQREFHVKRLIRDMRDFGPELRSLKKRGFVAQEENISIGWRVRPQAFLWWLADELVRTVRDETPFEEWLQKQEFGVLLTRGEKQQLDKGVRTIVGLLKGGVTTLIEAAAKGAAEAIVK